MFRSARLPILLALSALASLAQAQATRTWVSGVGDDANPCSRTAPCKTFAGAISKTAAGGEINAIDPGGYGAVTITKAITIDGGGTFASILNSGTNGVVVNAGATDVVRLRNISINGGGTGLNGVRVLAAKAVHIENVVIMNNTQNGIDLATAANTALFVSDTMSRNNTLNGIALVTTGGLVRANIQRSTFANNTVNGALFGSSTRVSVVNSSFDGNTQNGAQVQGLTNGLIAQANFETSDFSNNGNFGVAAGNAAALATGIVRLSNNQINSNVADGVRTLTNGFVESFSNNKIRGNGTNGCAGCTTVVAN